MEITGEDSVFITNRDPSASIKAFLSDLTHQWPDVVVYSRNPGDNAENFRPWATEPSPIPQGHGSILIARDDQMATDWDDQGYELDAYNEGPLYILYEPALWDRLEIQVLQNPYEDQGIGFDPYEVTLTGRGYHLVTIVTPPLDSTFSQRILAKLKDFL